MKNESVTARWSALAIVLTIAIGVSLAEDSPTSSGSATPDSAIAEPRTDLRPREAYVLGRPGDVGAEETARREAMLRGTHLPIPVPTTFTSAEISFTTSEPTSAGFSDLLAPTDFRIFRDTTLGATASPSSSVINEPSVATNGGTVFYTGNWYASLSTDGGRTFSFVDPDPGPGPSVNNGFCCDQIAIYDPGHNSIFWLQQFSADANSGTQRINVDMGADGTFDCYYDFNPQMFGRPTGEWLDFPDLVLGSNFLYHTSNIFDQSVPNNRFTRSLVARYPLNQIASCVGMTVPFFLDDSGSPRATHGTGGTVYWGTHRGYSTLRIYRWPENSGTISWDDRSVSSWTDGVGRCDRNGDGARTETCYDCPGPDGRDMCERSDGRILGSYVARGELGFMWNAAQDGSFPYPHVRIARFRESDRSLLGETQIWNSGYAWVYPSVGVNSRGDLGGAILVGGGTEYEDCAVWISDDVNGHALAGLENVVVAQSTAGPRSNAAGDYTSGRPHEPYSASWVASCYGLRSSGASGDPRYLWFGRERDFGNRPPITEADGPYASECTSPSGAPIRLDGIGSHDPDGDPLSYRWTGPFVGGSASGVAPIVTFPIGSSTVTLEATDEYGASSQDTATVNVLDTTPPFGQITFPSDGMCFGGAVTVTDDFRDICDVALTRTYNPPPGPTYSSHGDHLVTLTAADDSGNSASDSVGFTVDLVAPTVTILEPVDRTRILPSSLPLSTVFTSSDEDGATGGVVYEEIQLRDQPGPLGRYCTLYSGLLSGQTIQLSREELCRVTAPCNFGVLVQPRLRVEATDCGGNRGSAHVDFSGSVALRPGICDPFAAPAPRPQLLKSAKTGERKTTRQQLGR